VQPLTLHGRTRARVCVCAQWYNNIRSISSTSNYIMYKWLFWCIYTSNASSVNTNLTVYHVWLPNRRRKEYLLFNICINPLNAELNPICHLLALLGAHHILHISKIRVNTDNSLHNSFATPFLEKCHGPTIIVTKLSRTMCQIHFLKNFCIELIQKLNHNVTIYLK
jgi:hypothetical protein